MRTSALAILGTLVAIAPARADAVRRAVVPMTRADGAVCDLLRSDALDRCRPIATEGPATVYQSGSKHSGIRRVVLAVAAGDEVLVSPPIDVRADRLDSTVATVRPIAIDGRPGLVLDVVSTWRDGVAPARAEAVVGCAPAGRGWRCAVVDVGACAAAIGDDATVSTACGPTASLALAR